MKKLLLLLISFNIYASFLDSNFKAQIVEISKNSSKKEYILTHTNNKYEIEILSPSINKGEIYTYDNKVKSIYYPKLKQTVKQSFNNEDTDIIALLNDIKNIKTSTIKKDKKYIVKNSNVVRVETNNYNIDIKYNHKNFPEKITISNQDEKVEFLWKY